MIRSKNSQVHWDRIYKIGGVAALGAVLVGLVEIAITFAGLLGFGMLMLFEVISSFVLGLGNVTMLLAMLGGLFAMVWYVLIARRLFRLELGSERSGRL